MFSISSILNQGIESGQMTIILLKRKEVNREKSSAFKNKSGKLGNSFARCDE
jgi:hypothetical protein